MATTTMQGIAARLRQVADAIDRGDDSFAKIGALVTMGDTEEVSAAWFVTPVEMYQLLGALDVAKGQLRVQLMSAKMEADRRREQQADAKKGSAP